MLQSIWQEMTTHPPVAAASSFKLQSAKLFVGLGIEAATLLQRGWKLSRFVKTWQQFTLWTNRLMLLQVVASLMPISSVREFSNKHLYHASRQAQAALLLETLMLLTFRTTRLKIFDFYRILEESRSCVARKAA